MKALISEPQVPGLPSIRKTELFNNEIGTE